MGKGKRELDKRKIGKREQSKLKYPKTKIIIIATIMTVIILMLTIIYIKREPIITYIKKEILGQREIGENWIEIDDGKKQNTSYKLKETKIIEGLEWSNITIVEENKTSTIKAQIKNTAKEVKGDYKVRIDVLDEEGKIILRINAYVEKIEPERTIEFKAIATEDFVNACDIKIVPLRTGA